LLRTLFFYVIVVIGFSSCELFEPKDDREVIARVGDNYLYEEDVEDLKVEDDSAGTAVLIQKYIDNWVKEQLLLKKALQNLSEEQVDFEAQLNNYKNSLLIYAYENLLVKQKLDTNISKTQLKAYYKNNEQNFKLKEQLIKGKLVQLLNSAPMQDSLNLWIFHEGDKYTRQLNEYCTQFTMNCHLDTSEWIPFSTIRNLLPLTYQVEQIDINLGKNVLSDTMQTTVINVMNQRFPGQLAPLSYVSDQIKSIIRNKRKLQLLSKAREEIYEEATLKKQYEIYN